jgi:DNA-binding LacI/PurR family transcriptional regulator
MNRKGKNRAQERTVSRRTVAKAAGVSLTTVTHALNPPPGVRMSEETRARVLQVAQKLGYRPSFTGRALVSGKTYAVGLLQPKISSMYYRLYQDIVIGLAEAMQPDDYHPLLLFRSDDDQCLKPIQQGRVDGLFILQSDPDLRLVDKVVASGIPTVVVNKGIATLAGKPVGCVHSDHAGMIRSAIAELCGLGCRTLAAIHDPLCSDANTQLQDAFNHEMAQRTSAGIVGSTIVPVAADFRTQIRSLLKNGRCADGIFIDGPDRADIFVEEASSQGLQSGRDFQLVVCADQDGMTTSSRSEHSAYTQQPMLVGQEAWHLMRALINNEALPKVVQVPYKRHAVKG